MMMRIIVIIVIIIINMPDIVIKNKKRKNMHTDRCGNTRRQKCCAKGSGK